jgi:hypothetical protein
VSSFPAFDHFEDQLAAAGDNIRRGFSRWKVYRHLWKAPVLEFEDQP